MWVRKRTFLEIIFPITVVFFTCVGTSFIDAIHATVLRWIFDFILFLYLFLNKKLLLCLKDWQKILLFSYLIWCVSTTAWSEVPILSFTKSIVFASNVIIMISAGSFWVIKYGFKRSFDWLALLLIVVLFSGFLGSAHTGSASNWYTGSEKNANAFGFLVAIVSPLIFWKLYLHKTHKLMLFGWLFIMLVDVRFLFISYSRSSIAIFMCTLAFFVISLPFSKKILLTLLSFFCIIILLIMTPVSYLESIITNHIVKSYGQVSTIDTKDVFHSRNSVWKKSMEQAKKGGVMGGGFAVTIGDKNISSTQLINGAAGRVRYGREKGNSQFEIMEETGIVGLILYALILISFFAYVIPYYLRFKGPEKVAMGLSFGVITGLLLESIVEGWWDSSAGPELICFWTLVGIVYGMIYLRKKQGY